jgi:hypothetical protein
VTVPNKPSIPDKPVSVEFDPVELAALIVVAQHGLRAVEAFGLVKNTGAMEVAIRKLQAARR